MAIRHKFGQRQTAMPVPYGPSYENGRTNHGFVDLRGRPREAARVVEAIGSIALRGILVRAAEKSSPLFTIGCDLGRHRWSRTGLKNPEVAGGYLHLAIADYQSADSQLYQDMAEKIVVALKPYSAQHRWRIGLLVEFCEFQLDNENVLRRPFRFICGLLGRRQ
jgi:hypothetical protein